MGIWHAWIDKETKETLKTFSIITTQATPLLAVIHNTKKRMPVILRPEGERKWLSDIPLEETVSLLAPYDEKAMEALSVKFRVGFRSKASPHSEAGEAIVSLDCV